MVQTTRRIGKKGRKKVKKEQKSRKSNKRLGLNGFLYYFVKLSFFVIAMLLSYLMYSHYPFAKVNIHNDYFVMNEMYKISTIIPVILLVNFTHRFLLIDKAGKDYYTKINNDYIIIEDSDAMYKMVQPYHKTSDGLENPYMTYMITYSLIFTTVNGIVTLNHPSPGAFIGFTVGLVLIILTMTVLGYLHSRAENIAIDLIRYQKNEREKMTRRYEYE